MKTANELVQANVTTKPQEPSFAHSKEGMAKTWRALVAMKLHHQEVGSTDFHYWRHGLRNFDDSDLDRGVKNALDFKGKSIDFSLGTFRDMCKPIILAPSHKPFKALPKPKMTPEQRKAAMAEAKKKTGKLI